MAAAKPGKRGTIAMRCPFLDRRYAVADHFCTCTDLTCPRNPRGPHAKHHSCDLCVRHCLRMGEVPACFFKAVHADTSSQTDYSYAGFAAYVDEHTGR